MVSIDNAIRFPFKNKDWKETVGIYFLILLAVSMISGILRFFLRLPSALSDSSVANSNSLVAAQMLMAMISIGLSIIIFPVTTYLVGYVTEVAKNVMNGKEEIGKHGQIWERVKLGLVRYLINIFYGIPALLVIIFGIVFLIVGATQQYSNPSIYTLGLVIFFSTLFIFFVWVCFIQPFFDKSALYFFLKTEKISSIFDVMAVGSLIKDNFSGFLFMYGTDILAGLAQILAFATCCLIFLAQPAIQTIAAFSKAYIDGNVYRQISEKK